MTTYVQNIIDGARKSKIKKNDACANVIQANFYAAFELCLNPLLESLGRSKISSPCALDATVEYLRQKLDPVNPTIIHGISVCARGGGRGRAAREPRWCAAPLLLNPPRLRRGVTGRCFFRPPVEPVHLRSPSVSNLPLHEMHGGW